MEVIVQANPGFALVQTDEDDAWIEGPIIAWRIGDTIYPITEFESIGDSHSGWAVQRPDGRISVWWDNQVYYDLETFKASRKKAPAVALAPTRLPFQRA